MENGEKGLPSGPQMKGRERADKKMGITRKRRRKPWTVGSTHQTNQFYRERGGGNRSQKRRGKDNKVKKKKGGEGRDVVLRRTKIRSQR